MGLMKDFDIRIRNGGDDAVIAACEYAGCRWMSVLDSVPEDNEWVLVACKTGEKYDVGIAKAVGTQLRLGYDSSDMVPRITHWMPLPAPPTDAK